MRIYRVGLLLLLLVGLAGCDYLSYDENTDYNEEDIFSDFGRTKGFLTNIYGRVPSGFQVIDGAMRASATDLAESGQEYSAVQNFNDGSWSPTRTTDEMWGSMYGGIRAVNRFLRGVEGANYEDRAFNEDYERLVQQFERFPHEARFLRAYFYYELIRRYGDVPLVTSVLTPEEANNVEATGFEEVVEFIVDECDAIAPQLPVTYTTQFEQETGRATRGAAMALKANTLLYAASALHNPSDDRAKWERAAQAAHAIIDSSWYSLEDTYANLYSAENDNEQAFASEEVIWERREGTSNYFERNNFPFGFEGTNEAGTWPTQNLVDAYDMQTTGKDIEDFNSGYDPEQPYENRDPRLYATVVVNGSTWREQTVETWRGGANGLPLEGATETGYYLKKYVEEAISLEPSFETTRLHTWILFRYGEVLLNYAEAMFEAYGAHNAAGMSMTAYDAVNRVRERAGMPPLEASIAGGEFQDALREERMVELAFEGHRFWDIRRWKIGPETTRIYAMNITREADETFDYEKVLLEDRAWDNRMYLYPIPQSELFANRNLEQNPGW